jgi:hypothetical protein
MADQAKNKLIAQLQTDVLALEEAAVAKALAVAAATAGTAATVQQNAAAAAQQAAAAAVPLPAPVFMLAPALANTAAFFYFASSDGAKLFKGATEALNSHAFDFEDDSALRVFLALVLTKSQVWGWNAIFDIPVADAPAATARNWNLLTHHGVVPLDSVRTHAMSHCATPSKRAQDSFMLCQCLLNSLTLDFLKTITTDADICHLPAIVAVTFRLGSSCSN